MRRIRTPSPNCRLTTSACTRSSDPFTLIALISEAHGISARISKGAVAGVPGSVRCSAAFTAVFRTSVAIREACLTRSHDARASTTVRHGVSELTRSITPTTVFGVKVDVLLAAVFIIPVTVVPAGVTTRHRTPAQGRGFVQAIERATRHRSRQRAGRAGRLGAARGRAVERHTLFAALLRGLSALTVRERVELIREGARVRA
jgi:hypothetical protein